MAAKKYTSRIEAEVDDNIEIERMEEKERDDETVTAPSVPDVPQINAPSEPSLEGKQLQAKPVSKFDGIEGRFPERPDEITNSSMNITEDNLMFIEVRSRQLGIPKKDYMNLLVGEYIERTDDIGNYEVIKYCQQKFAGLKRHITFPLATEYVKSFERACAVRGMNKSMYFNYIVDAEIERERTTTPRKGKFD